MANPKFPLKTTLAFATCIAALVVYRRFAEPGKGISPGIFRQAAHLELFRHAPAPMVPVPAQHPLNGIQQPQGAGALEPISPNLIDDSGALDSFFAALAELEKPATSATPQVVTVLHYGDSPTTADLITGDVRSLLQQRFGDAGDGFLLTAKPWAWYGHRNTDISDSGWQTSTAVGKGREETYGLGGASFQGSAGARSHITLKNGGQTTMELAYLAQPNGGTLSVSSNDGLSTTVPTAAETTHPAWRLVPLSAGTRTVDLSPASGRVQLFGESFLTGKRGVLYDSLGLNGASTTVLSNGFNAAAWAAELQHEQPKLVIINYGTNESSFGSFVDKQYEPVLRATIARIRAALPNVAILIMSPMDRGRHTGVDGIETYDTIPRIIAIQRRVAADQHCAFFDTFDAMGGDGTMARWYNGHPRLVAGDLIHPTPQGAALVAQLFVHDLSLGYDRYLRRQNKTTAPAAVPTTPQPAAPAPPPVTPGTPLAPPTVPSIMKPADTTDDPAPETPPASTAPMRY